MTIDHKFPKPDNIKHNPKNHISYLSIHEFAHTEHFNFNFCDFLYGYPLLHTGFKDREKTLFATSENILSYTQSHTTLESTLVIFSSLDFVIGVTQL